MSSGSKRAWDVLRWIDRPLHDAIITLPFPLETGQIARLSLPRDLLRTEADRLCAMLQAWCPDA